MGQVKQWGIEIARMLHQDNMTVDQVTNTLMGTKYEHPVTGELVQLEDRKWVVEQVRAVLRNPLIYNKPGY